MCVRAAIVHIIYSKMGIDQMPNFKTTTQVYLDLEVSLANHLAVILPIYIPPVLLVSVIPDQLSILAPFPFCYRFLYVRNLGNLFFSLERGVGGGVTLFSPRYSVRVSTLTILS